MTQLSGIDCSSKRKNSKNLVEIVKEWIVKPDRRWSDCRLNGDGSVELVDFSLQNVETTIVKLSLWNCFEQSFPENDLLPHFLGSSWSLTEKKQCLLLSVKSLTLSWIRFIDTAATFYFPCRDSKHVLSRSFKLNYW